MTRRSFFATLFGGAVAGVGAVLLGWRQQKRLRFKVRFRMATMPPNRWIAPILFKRNYPIDD